MKKKFIITGAVAIVLIALVIVGFKAFRKESQNVTFETTKVVKGTVQNTVTATGTIQAIKTVEVGTQVSGVILNIYADFNSFVKKGQLLAELDRRPLQTNLQNSQANFDNAQAEVTYQTSNFNRVKALYDKNLVAQTDYDLALYNFTRAQASIKTATAELSKAKINLDYASIYSPIDGVILDRAVDEGQTVAASFNTPTLFTIANDLTQMQVEASIDEADIGQIKNGQKVNFTVDAFTDQKFNGEVTEIRLQPVTKSNVVTYTVIVKAPNPDKKLMPGMTANITVIVNEAANVAVVASKALRFTPDNAMMANYMKTLPVSELPKPGGEQGAMPGTPPPMQPEGISTKTKQPEVWIKTGKFVRPAKVEIGLNDDVNAQVLSGLKEGDEVVVSMSAGASASSAPQAAASSPFMPKPPSRK